MTGTTQEQWQDQYRGHSVRLVITCRVGDEEWMLARPCQQQPSPFVTTDYGTEPLTVQTRQ